MGCLDRVVLAVDDVELAEAARAFGAEVVMTSPSHPSGTDRVAEVAARGEFAEFDVVANLQGDEPLLEEAHVAAAIELVRGAGWDAGTVATPVRSATEWRDPAAVKVVRDDRGGALYFSRAPIPAVRDGEPGAEAFAEGPETASFLRHVGLYTYRRDALARWVALPEGRLEALERLEQLRPLAAGIRIGVAVVDSAAPGVDTPEDAAFVERLLTEHTAASP
jgi:3-deoxy-manno-octulosonate cytidylyltransferase (CMP-KDO synthetase)